jgi:hypothetical protein
VSVVQYIGEPVEKNVLSWKQLMAVGEEAGPESRMAAKLARNFYEMFTEISYLSHFTITFGQSTILQK